MDRIASIKKQILQAYQPEGGCASWEIYGEAVHALMQEAALRVAEVRAMLPLSQAWKNEFPMESYGVEGSLFRFIRETYRFMPVKSFGAPLTVSVRGLVYPQGTAMGLAKEAFFARCNRQNNAERLKSWLIQALEFQWPLNMLLTHEDNDPPALLLATREPQSRAQEILTSKVTPYALV